MKRVGREATGVEAEELVTFLDAPETVEPTVLTEIILDPVTLGVIEERIIRPTWARPKPDFPLYDIRTLMERPFFTLSAKPVPALPRYVSPDKRLWLEVTSIRPDLGVASLRDADILIYLISRLIADQSAERSRSTTLQIEPAALLSVINRQAGGRQYRLLRGSLERLTATRWHTNIAPDGKPGRERCTAPISGFTEIEGRRGLAIEPCEWILTAIEEKAILPIDPSYFTLADGLQSWLYRTSRKHAGHQKGGWLAALPMLHAKSGAQSSYAKFCHRVRAIAAENRLPGYQLMWVEPVTPRGHPELHMRPR